MPNKTVHLPNLINIKSPCSADWDSMTGNEQVRFCGHCDLKVHNLSELTPNEVMRLVLRSKGRLCVRYLRAPDGAIKALPERLHQIKRRASRIAAGAFSAALSLSSAAAAHAASPSRAAPSSGVEIASLKGLHHSERLQTSGSALSGNVLDPQGAAVPGARVTLVSESTGLDQMVMTGDEGQYRFQGLEAGLYTLRTESAGFKMNVVNNIPLDGVGGVSINLGLELNMEELTSQVVLMGDVSISAPSSPLVIAAMEDDASAVKELLSAGANANVVDETFQVSALAIAVAKGNLEMTQHLLWYGADVNLKNPRGQTALMNLGSNSTAEVVRALVAAGAKLDIQDEDGYTALMFVVNDDNMEVLQALLDAGAPVNTKNQKGQTALMLAASRGNLDQVKALIAAGADIYERDEEGSTVLKHARDNDHRAVMKLLRTYGAIEYSLPR